MLHPIILKYLIDTITAEDDDPTLTADGASTSTYMLVIIYATVKFSADFVNNIREIPFANVAASAETYIAHLVYNHI